jgi:hypothetical protein
MVARVIAQDVWLHAVIAQDVWLHAVVAQEHRREVTGECTCRQANHPMDAKLMQVLCGTGAICQEQHITVRAIRAVHVHPRKSAGRDAPLYG